MGDSIYRNIHVQQGTAAASNMGSVSFTFSEIFSFIPKLIVTAKDPDAHVSLTVSSVSREGASVEISSPVPNLVISYVAMGRDT
jgi:hypothetical protein